MRTPSTARGLALLVSGTALTTCLAAAPAGAGTSALPTVTATSESAALYDDEAGGNSDADDPAIWRNPADPDRSLVVATVKEGGLRVYDLDARLVQSVPAPNPPTADDAPGRYNNVDLVTGLRTSAGPADVAVVSDRGNDRLRIHRLDPSRPNGPLTDITDPAAAPVFSADQAEINDQHTAYGLATWSDRATGRTYALVSQRERTRLALLELVPAAHGKVGYRKIRTLDLPSSFRLPDGTRWSPCGEPGELPQVEGMVVDPATGTLYAGQEDIGIWRLRADLTGKPVLVDRTKEYGVPGTYDEESEECAPGADPGYGGKRLSADVEGLTIYQERDGEGYLLASSQGDNTFALYDREVSEGNEYEGGFRIGAASDTLDGVQECDGAAVLNAPLGSRYPRGLLVVQDGHETPGTPDGEGGTRTATGFKFVDLGELVDATGM
ncbi:phytase [Streptomyces europaeiscabiei]|uniref:phytase n=1 Tax=Streptomyces europaeiscabiei TaxID=146819 RepID=UPI00099C4714|nr:phytase [Streptomyces europaeiscabiei]MDX2529677.1 phytase [Streptomyces europaeiscabiei]MDX2758126.1 phytase [Streptomyces europaeiscabiei]MDX2767932.1 phytase [Streptomyces europaeiscabiei]MDX3779256.1 phytase [Streptomyces europaeiscabiei]MDX3862256.1 phytase [Streptomyces europaeiscabiei]